MLVCRLIVGMWFGVEKIVNVIIEEIVFTHSWPLHFFNLPLHNPSKSIRKVIHRQLDFVDMVSTTDLEKIRHSIDSINKVTDRERTIGDSMPFNFRTDSIQEAPDGLEDYNDPNRPGPSNLNIGNHNTIFENFSSSLNSEGSFEIGGLEVGQPLSCSRSIGRDMSRSKSGSTNDNKSISIEKVGESVINV